MLTSLQYLQHMMYGLKRITAGTAPVTGLSQVSQKASGLELHTTLTGEELIIGAGDRVHR